MAGTDGSQLRILFRDALAGRLSRRTVLRQAAALGLAAPVVGALLSACGADTPNTPVTSVSTTAAGVASPTIASAMTKAPGTMTAATTATQGGELRLVSVGDEPKLLDAHIDPFGSAAMVCAWLSDMLVFQDAGGKFSPYLASSWQVSDDGTVWTFVLRKDVKFQDGTPFNAAAAKFN